MWSAGLFAVLAAGFVSSSEVRQKTFEIDYENDTFLMDGQPFRYISGSVHYFRIPHQYWKDRLRKVRLLGFNAISTYIEWSLHEPRRGEYNFHGGADVERFLRLAREEGLYVILRPGPYICAEREFGGYPAWLLSENPAMKLRTSDTSHAFFISKWFQELFKRITPFLYGNGGPVIMVQVENEYGSYPKHDKKYLGWLRDLYLSYVGDKAVLFTTDGWYQNMVNRGKIPGVFSTVDFGTTTESVLKLFEPLRKVQPHGPLVNSEFYTGWLSYWGDPLSRVNTFSIIRTMRDLIQANVSFNCYMIHGGTNFGFTSGSGSDSILKLDLTSYDYDAPISEAGDLTDKYFAIRDLLREFNYSVGSDEEIETLQNKSKGNYGPVLLEPVVSLLESPISTGPETTRYPQAMETFNQSYGLISYTHIVTDPPKDPSVLQVNVRDRALVLLDNVEISVLAYTVINETPMPPTMKTGMNLTLLVENQGRRNYQLLSDVTKGIISNATLDGKILENWVTVGYPLTTEDIRRIENLAAEGVHEGSIVFPAFFTANFTLPPPPEKANEIPQTLDMLSEVAKISSQMVAVSEASVDEIAAKNLSGLVDFVDSNGETGQHLEAQTTSLPVSTDSDIDDAKSVENVEKDRNKREISQAESHNFPLDSYLDMTGWGKGIVFVNGYNLGRYWHIGPQMTLYAPGVWLKPYPETNTITILELHYTHPDRTVKFVPEPKFDMSRPSVRLLF